MIIFQCSFLPKFHITIQTRYENNNGCTENVSLSLFYLSIYLNMNS